MTGMHSMTFSPWSFSTSRRTPWVEGCWGPMLRMSSSVSSPSWLSITGSRTPEPSVDRGSAGGGAAGLGRTDVLSSPALEDLLAQPEHALGQRLGAWRAAGNVHVDRDDRVDALQRRVAVPELAAGARAVAHRDEPLGLGHLLVQPAEPRGHLVGDGAGDDHHVGLARTRTEDLGAEPREVMVGCGAGHHLDRTAREAVAEGPGTPRPRPVHEHVHRGEHDVVVARRYAGDHLRLVAAHAGLAGQRPPLDDVLFEIDGMDVGGSLLIDRHLAFSLPGRSVTCPQQREERRVHALARRDDLVILRPRDRTAGFAYEQLAGRGVPWRARDLEVRIEPRRRDPGEVERRGSCTAEVAHRAGEPRRDGSLFGTLGRVVAEPGRHEGHRRVDDRTDRDRSAGEPRALAPRRREQLVA